MAGVCFFLKKERFGERMVTMGNVIIPYMENPCLLAIAAGLSLLNCKFL